jgi:hypothetical protein
MTVHGCCFCHQSLTMIPEKKMSSGIVQSHWFSCSYCGSLSCMKCSLEHQYNCAGCGKCLQKFGHPPPSIAFLSECAKAMSADEILAIIAKLEYAMQHLAKRDLENWCFENLLKWMLRDDYRVIYHSCPEEFRILAEAAMKNQFNDVPPSGSIVMIGGPGMPVEFYRVGISRILSCRNQEM